MTQRERQFVDAYLADPKRNAVQAAITAGYSPNTARFASRWLNPADARNYKREVAEVIKEELDRIHSERTADAKEVLEYLTAVMRGECTEEVLRLAGNGFQTIDRIEVSAKERNKAAELLGKSYGLFKDNVNVDIEPVIIVNDLTE